MAALRLKTEQLDHLSWNQLQEKAQNDPTTVYRPVANPAPK